MFSELFTSAPIWVWPLLIVLIYFGLRARHDRWVPVYVIYAMPMLGVLSIGSTLALPDQMVVWTCFVMAYAIGATLGIKLQQNWSLARDGKRIKVAGEWVTMCTILIIFVASFANGFLLAVMPDIMVLPPVYLGITAIKAIVSGVFIGRAYAVWRFMKRQDGALIAG